MINFMKCRDKQSYFSNSKLNSNGIQSEGSKNQQTTCSVPETVFPLGRLLAPRYPASVQRPLLEQALYILLILALDPLTLLSQVLARLSFQLRDALVHQHHIRVLAAHGYGRRKRDLCLRRGGRRVQERMSGRMLELEQLLLFQ